jgi:hypothetical protein
LQAQETEAETYPDYQQSNLAEINRQFHLPLQLSMTYVIQDKMRRDEASLCISILPQRTLARNQHH